MTPIESAPVLAGGELSTLDSTACQGYLAWLLGDREATVPEEAIRLDWALAHCDDGVTWGTRPEEQVIAWVERRVGAGLPRAVS